VFTRNAFCAAPVLLCREILASGEPVRGLLINSGCANAGTGRGGLDAARRTVQAAAKVLGAGHVLPFSTGVIGQALPVDRVVAALPAAADGLDAHGWLDAARAIMTTDTVPKGANRRVDAGGNTITVTGIAKGAGMICPDMATLLAFVGTDARIAPEALRQLLREAADASFNSITVDGDTSTNDAVVLFSTGAAGGPELAPSHPDFAVVAQAVHEVCTELAQAVVRDGEGATRFITINVVGARDRAEARRVGYAVAHSPLVKTACFAGDANWGRILAAVGRSGLVDLDLSRVHITVDEVRLISSGEPDADYQEARGAAVFARPEITLCITLGRGDANAHVWTCDLSYDYVRINAEYRT
jgi:glutamate N-acetyltransferase / amino-acid N-acetyltransferase